MAENNGNGAIAIPKWFLAIASVILFAAVPWAGKQSIDIAIISTEMKSLKEEVSRRFDRNEALIDKLNEQYIGGRME